jgi:hypothetical protein
VKNLKNADCSFVLKSLKMRAKDVISILTKHAIKGKREKIKQGERDFFFYLSYPYHLAFIQIMLNGRVCRNQSFARFTNRDWLQSIWITDLSLSQF